MRARPTQIIELITLLPSIGYIFRTIGSFLVVNVAYRIWLKQTISFPEIRNNLSRFLLMETIYLLTSIPNFIFILMFGTLIIFGSYILQTILTIPFLLLLRRKINNNTDSEINLNIKKWSCITFVAYLGSIWVNHITRWLDMALVGGIPMLLDALNPLGFFNALIILSLSVIFAFIGFFKIENDGILSKWFGLSITFIGLHFIILVIFYILQNSPNVLYLFELWTIPLFGVGLSIISKYNG
jgi:hypothetical protein